MSKTVVNVLLLVISIGLAIAGQIAMKAGMNDVKSVHGDLTMQDFAHPITLIKWLFKDGPWAVGGIVLYAISALFWMVVLSRVALSVAYPMVAVGYVVVVLYSRFVFNEQVKWIAWVGLAFIVLGVAITAQGLKSNTSENEKTLQKPAKQVVAGIDAPRDKPSE